MAHKKEIMETNQRNPNKPPPPPLCSEVAVPSLTPSPLQCKWKALKGLRQISFSFRSINIITQLLPLTNNTYITGVKVFYNIIQSQIIMYDKFNEF